MAGVPVLNADGPAARADVLSAEKGTVDYCFGLADVGKAEKPSHISCLADLRDTATVNAEALGYYQTITHGECAEEIDAFSALDAWGIGPPGFAWRKLGRRTWPRMRLTTAAYVEGGSDTLHSADGNATIARLLVSRLAPGAIVGNFTEIVAARCDYGQLDALCNAARMRRTHIVASVRHLDDPITGRQVEIINLRAGQRSSVTAESVSWLAGMPCFHIRHPIGRITAGGAACPFRGATRPCYGRFAELAGHQAALCFAHSITWRLCGRA